MKETDSAVTRHGSIWLTVRGVGKSWVFELARGVDRVVSVGASSDVDVQLDFRGNVPLAFHFEREGDGVCIVPAYGGDLRVNAARVSDVFRMLGRAVVELAGVRLDVEVLRERPAAGAVAMPGAAAARDARAYSAALVDESQPTRAVEVLRPEDMGATSYIAPLETSFVEAPTEAMSAMTFDDEPPPRAAALPAPPTPLAHKPLIGPAVLLSQPIALPREVAPEAPATEIMGSMPELEEEPRAAAPAPEAVQARAPVPARMVVPAALADTGPTEAVAFEQVKPTAAPLAVVQANEEDTSAFEMLPQRLEPGASAPPTAQSLESQRTGAAEQSRPSSSFLRTVGLAAKEKPVLVLGGAVIVAGVLSLALVGATKVMSPANSEAKVASAKGESPVQTPSAATAQAVEKASPRAAAAPAAPEEPTAKATQTTEPQSPDAPATAARAVNHLRSGRYEEAANAYRALAAASPDSKAYDALARLLTRRSSELCSGGATAAACPEVRQ